MGGDQAARRRGGRKGTASIGDASGRHERRSRGTARKQWQFILLRTALRGVWGGCWGNCGESTPWEVRVRERGRSFLGICCSSPGTVPRRPPCEGRSRQCGLRRTWPGSPQPLPRFTGELPRAEGVQVSNFTFSPECCERRQEKGGGSRVGGPWWHSCACPGLLSLGLVRPHPSGWRIFGGRNLLGFGPPNEGSLDGGGAGGRSGQGHGASIYASTRKGGMGTSGWSQEDPRFLKALWRVSSKGRSGRMGGGTVTAGGGGGGGCVGATSAGGVVPLVREVGG